MPAKKPAKAGSPVSSRTSVTFPVEIYNTLEKIALQKKVSVAWVIRDAAEKYINEQWPLLARRE